MARSQSDCPTVLVATIANRTGRALVVDVVLTAARPDTVLTLDVASDTTVAGAVGSVATVVTLLSAEETLAIEAAGATVATTAATGGMGTVVAVAVALCVPLWRASVTAPSTTTMTTTSGRASQSSVRTCCPAVAGACDGGSTLSAPGSDRLACGDTLSRCEPMDSRTGANTGGAGCSDGGCACCGSDTSLASAGIAGDGGGNG